ASVLVYRIVSFILVAIVGWIVFLVLFRKQDNEDLAADRDLRERELAELEAERAGRLSTDGADATDTATEPGENQEAGPPHESAPGAAPDADPGDRHRPADRDTTGGAESVDG